MLIVVEGADASGKSTLARAISEALGWPLHLSDGREKHPGEINHRVEHYLRLRGYVCDRHPVVSQHCYRVVEPKTRIRKDLIAAFYGSRNIFVYCDGDISKMVERHKVKEHEEAGWEERVWNQYSQLLCEYRTWAIQHAHFIYRIGDSPAWIVNGIQGIILGDRFPNAYDDVWQSAVEGGVRYIANG